jgi:hypothetical protein
MQAIFWGTMLLTMYILPSWYGFLLPPLFPSWNHSSLESYVIQQAYKLPLAHASQRHSLVLIWIHSQKVLIGQSL